MNIPGNLELYRQIIEFENDATRDEMLFKDLDRSKQRAVQAIAHNRNLEYEYQSGCAKVFCEVVSDVNYSLPENSHEDLPRSVSNTHSYLDL